MQQLSGQDAMFLHAEMDGLPQHIGGLAIYDQSTAKDGIVRFKQILKLFEDRTHLSPIFTRKLQRVPMGLDQPYWVESDDYDVERHLHHIALPKPGDWRQLCILVARLHARPLDMTLPLWEMYVIEGLDNIKTLPKGCFAVLTKVHHAAMDGATGAKFMPLMHDLSPKIEPTPAGGPRVIERMRTADMLGRAYINNLRKPRQFIKLVRQTVPALRRIKLGKEQGDFKSLEDKQKTRFQQPASRHRVCDAVQYDFQEVRKVKGAVDGATINDVMLTVVAGALRKYLESKRELPEQPLVAGCPIDVRSDAERMAGGNMIGFMAVSLHSDIKDPLERLATIHESAKGSKKYAEALGPRIMMDVTDVVPGGMMALAMRASTATGLGTSNVMFNTIVTNVPGPPVQFYFCGARLVDGLSFGPLLPGVGLFHIVYSTVMNKKGTISISYTACRDMIPDPEFYSECLQSSYDELKTAALA